MLELKQIVKDYPVASSTVHALKGVDLQFRRSEFVSVLGPSGCGKTTLLNIIGGLDKYTTGDLIIDGVSTTNYKDRDWDTYRNHTIGFVFQTYNLIPHQTVLKNVELALTLAGVPLNERKPRAEEALKKVGLGEHINKRPNQLSGGQMQRVAIARALVNDPDIILADEPTGALDTETGIQIMELLKEMSRDRLVIMVTHNPELAEQYSSRIIRILDGVIVGDSAPLTAEEYAAEKQAEERANADEQPVEAAQDASDGKTAAPAKKRKPKKKRSSMSFWTAFKLSLNNLFTKKGRTVLTSFAGSIGIIGIALILAVSQGTTNYIHITEERTLASYPLTIESTAMDLSSLVSTMMNNIDSEDSKNGNPDREEHTVYNSTLIYNVANVIKSSVGISNDLKTFKEEYLDNAIKEGGALHEAVAGVQYQYDADMRVFSKTVEGNVEEASVSKKMNEIVPRLLGSNIQSAMGGYMQSMARFSMNIWQEMLADPDGGFVNQLIKDQYEIYGEWPQKYNQAVLVVNKNMEVSDMALVTLGLLGNDYLDQLYADVDSGKAPDKSNLRSWSFDDIMKTDCRMILNGYLYAPAADGIWYDITEGDHAQPYKLQELFDDKDASVPIEISGIVWAKDESTSILHTGSIAYTSALTEYMITRSEGTPAVIEQKSRPDVDIFSGKAFGILGDVNADNASKADAFRAYYEALSFDNKREAYWNIQRLDSVEPLITMIKSQVTEDKTLAQVVAEQLAEAMNMNESTMLSFFAGKTNEQILNFIRSQMVSMVKLAQAGKTDTIPDGQTKMMLVSFANSLNQRRQEFNNLPQEEQKGELDGALSGKTDDQIAVYYDNEQMSSATYEGNLALLSNVDINTPVGVSIYATSFAAKDVIADEIEKYNDSRDNEEEKIQYTDLVALVMSAVTTIIDAVTYVLIAFVAISLIVSSIMIGVITLISVQERTKEIGILRAIGASKRDVSSMFNAETIIIGFAAGLLGVIVTYLLTIPINLILHAVTMIPDLNAVLPIGAAAILVAISVVLTMLSGLIPSRSAAKKDPVVALRTE